VTDQAGARVRARLVLVNQIELRSDRERVTRDIEFVRDSGVKRFELIKCETVE